MGKLGLYALRAAGEPPKGDPRRRCLFFDLVLNLQMQMLLWLHLHLLLLK